MRRFVVQGSNSAVGTEASNGRPHLWLALMLSLVVVSSGCGDDDGAPDDAGADVRAIPDGATPRDGGETDGTVPVDAATDAAVDASLDDGGPDARIEPCDDGLDCTVDAMESGACTHDFAAAETTCAGSGTCDGEGVCLLPGTRIVPEPHTGEQRFSEAVAIDGDIAVIGARATTSSDPHDSFYVAERTAGAWSRTFRSAGDDTMDTDLGAAVAVDGELVAVGAPETSDEGAVRLFRRSAPGVFEEVGVVGAMGSRGVGNALALDGDTLVIGTNQGFVHVCHGRPTFTDCSTLGPTGADFRLSGISMAVVDGERLVVGDDGVSASAGSAPGRVYVFDWDGTAFVESASIRVPMASGPGCGAFARSVALDGARLYVGRTGNFSMCDSLGGGVYVFQREDSAFTLATVIPVPEDESIPFGFRLSAGSEALLVGGAQTRAYLYRVVDGAFVLTARLVPPAGSPSRFATTVDLTSLGDGAIVSSAEESGPTDVRGAAYLYTLDGV